MTASLVETLVENVRGDVPPTREAAWIRLRPHCLADRRCRLLLRRCVRQLERIDRETVDPDVTRQEAIARVRSDATTRASEIRARVAVRLIACIHVLCDLKAQGWLFHLARNEIHARPPRIGASSVPEEKARVRAAHLIERDAQLSQLSVRRFIRTLERPRLAGRDWKSILSLVRDGRELARQLRLIAALPYPQQATALASVIDPYVQLVTPAAVCEFTRLKLAHVWRYFRHTWTTAYQSTPGRKVYFLVRDRAAPDHPVIGIGALGSPIVQLSVRDEWIGWTGSKFVDALRTAPSREWARWIRQSLKHLLKSIIIDDLLREGVIDANELNVPTDATVARLRAFAKAERRQHRLYPDRAQHKRAQIQDESGVRVNWRKEANTHLFRSKRAATLADLLDARRKLAIAGLRRASTHQLTHALETRAGQSAVHTILRAMKASRVGVNMMDITVCGSIAPYNELLGGKLVSLLMASPDIVHAYRERYADAPSVIASSMAGKSVCRPPYLVLLGTTSLYGVGASQYNRVRMPTSFAAGNARENALEFIRLGRTVGYGSYHFSRDTMAAFEVVLRRLRRGRPVNSIFGEGVNPKLRKVRGGLDALGLPSDLLLQHGSPRIVYQVPLATNFREVLLGVDRVPQYIVPQTRTATEEIVRFWRERWFAHRAIQPEIIERVAAHQLAHPIKHGARVVLPELLDEMGPLFSGRPSDWRRLQRVTGWSYDKRTATTFT